MKATLMDGFPPESNAQVTLANWRTPPFNVWAFHHVREIVPSADIPNDPDNVWTLPSAPIEMDDLQVPTEKGPVLPFSTVLEQTNTDGLVIIHRGQIVYEFYTNGLTAHTPHIMMSVSKSLLGLLAGILVARGVLDLEAPVTDYIPELNDTAYVGASLRHLLDMRAGIFFDEDYLATDGPIIEYRKATNWNPLEEGESPSDLRSFFQTLTASDGPHEGRFHYVSPNTDLFAWVIERASGQRYADLMGSLLWQPMGAERSGYITVDRLGAPRAAGGVCITARDLARVGLLMARDGRRGDRQVIPSGWLEDLLKGGSPEAWRQGTTSEYYPGLPIHYRSYWYIIEGDTPLIFGLGIHGQNVFIDPTHDLVIAKVSSQPLPMDAERITLTMDAVAAIRACFA